MKRITEAERLAFEHKQRQYYIQCAKHVLPLAPLPEFQAAIAMLEAYDAEPTKKNREYLKKIYRELSRKPGHEFGYTAVGEFYHGLCFILWHSLYRTNQMSSSDCQHFTEACYCAGETLHISEPEVWIGQRAQEGEYKWQSALWDKLHADADSVDAKEAA